MQHLELSRKALEEQCSTWANNIKEVYQPDLIIYIARGGYLIGKQMREVFQVSMIGVSTVRDGNGMKEKIGPLVAILPNCIRNLLISIELKSNKHAKNTERKVRFLKGVEDVKDKNIRKILVAEDSVDTGNSLQQAIKTIRTVFPDAEIKVASLNVWDKSKSIAHVDYIKAKVLLMLIMHCMKIRLLNHRCRKTRKNTRNLEKHIERKWTNDETNHKEMGQRTEKTCSSFGFR